MTKRWKTPSLSSNSELVEAKTDDGACLHYMSMSDAQTYAANKRSRIEDGCCLLCLTTWAKHALSLAQRRYIAELIQPKYLVEIMKSENIVFGSIPAFKFIANPETGSSSVWRGNQATQTHQYCWL
ncbi:hypothetical protein P4S64_16685 [Vibrio sp. M60_M31a]